VPRRVRRACAMVALLRVRRLKLTLYPCRIRKRVKLANANDPINKSGKTGKSTSFLCALRETKEKSTRGDQTDRKIPTKSYSNRPELSPGSSCNPRCSPCARRIPH